MSATIGEWGRSIYYAEPVTTVLVDALPWAGVLAGVAVVTGLVAHWGQSQLAGDRLPGWLLSYGAYVVVYVVGLFVLTASARGASGFYLGQAQLARDLPLELGARRLIALGFLVGALLLSVGRRYTADRVRTDMGTTANSRS